MIRSSGPVLVRNAVALALCAVLLFTTACKASEPEPIWIRDQVTAQDDRLLLDVTALALQKSGFPVGSGIDPSNLRIVSGWQNSLAPFRGTGWREQCEVQYEKTAHRQYKISIRVRHDKNDDILRPLDITYAEWVHDADDRDRARMVMQHIRSQLDTGITVGEKP